MIVCSTQLVAATAPCYVPRTCQTSPGQILKFWNWETVYPKVQSSLPVIYTYYLKYEQTRIQQFSHFSHLSHFVCICALSVIKRMRPNDRVGCIKAQHL